ncbi:MAG: DUF2975 domain-containing protein [Gammaproteobacteria bacterium]|nr:DUF2975 domain-containing protein [Gammaproteobacteria bacterium]
MNKIQRISRYFKWLFQLIFIAMLFFYLWYWTNFIIFNAWPLQTTLHYFHSMTWLSAIPYSLDMETRLLCSLASLIPLIVNLIIVYLLIRLFALYQQGKIFTLKNVSTIRRIGYMILIGQAANIIYQILFSIVITWKNGPGHRTAGFELSSTNVGMIVTACLVILISWVMAEGCRLQEDSEYTI